MARCESINYRIRFIFLDKKDYEADEWLNKKNIENIEDPYDVLAHNFSDLYEVFIMKLINLSPAVKQMIGKQLLKHAFYELSEPITDKSLIELGEAVLKLFKDNKLKAISESTLQELFLKGKGDPKRHQFLNMKKEQIGDEFEKNTAQFPEGILASAYSNKEEYVAEAITEKLGKLGMLSTPSKKEAIENLQFLLTKVLEPCLIKDNVDPSPYIIQLGLLVEASASYGINEPKSVYENLKKTMRVESLTQFKKDNQVITLESMIESEFSAIALLPTNPSQVCELKPQ